MACRWEGYVLISTPQEEAVVAAFASVDRPEERKYGDPP
jgi:hypothetical protein